MSATRMYTEREVVVRERAASAKARCAALWTGQRHPTDHLGYVHGPCGDCERKAAERYPLPTVTRPRVWRDNPAEVGNRNVREFRYADGQLQTRVPATHPEWVCLTNGTSHATAHPDGFAITPSRIKAWADLVANPTEDVEAES